MLSDCERLEPLCTSLESGRGATCLKHPSSSSFPGPLIPKLDAGAGATPVGTTGSGKRKSKAAKETPAPTTNPRDSRNQVLRQTSGQRQPPSVAAKGKGKTGRLPDATAPPAAAATAAPLVTAHGRGRARQIAAAAASYGEEEEEELHMVADRHPVPVAAPAPRNARGVVAAIGHAEHRHGALLAPQVLPREEIPDQPYLADGGGSKSKDDGTEAARKAM